MRGGGCHTMCALFALQRRAVRLVEHLLLVGHQDARDRPQEAGRVVGVALSVEVDDGAPREVGGGNDE